MKGPETAATATNLVAGKSWVYVRNVTQPTMTVYTPSATNTGAAVVVFPGGGYQILAIDLEGTEVCDWLTSRGITCVLLKYRVLTLFLPETKTLSRNSCFPNALRALPNSAHTPYRFRKFPQLFESDRQRVEFLFALYEKLTTPHPRREELPRQATGKVRTKTRAGMGGTSTSFSTVTLQFTPSAI